MMLGRNQHYMRLDSIDLWMKHGTLQERQYTKLILYWY